MKIFTRIKFNKIILIGLLVAVLLASSGCTDNSESSGEVKDAAPAESSEATMSGGLEESAGIAITDGFGREVTVPENTEKVVCSGAGCLRYLVYLQAQDYVVGVDSIEKEKSEVEGRPYVLA